MRKYTSLIAFFVVLSLMFATAMPVVASSSEIESVLPRASYYLDAYSAYVHVTNSGQAQVWFEVMGTGDMDEIGVLSILLYESTDGKTWTRIKTFSHENYGTTMLAEDDWYVSSHVSTQGVKGRYYKAYVCFWAGKNGSGDTRYMWTSVTS